MASNYLVTMPKGFTPVSLYPRIQTEEDMAVLWAEGQITGRAWCQWGREGHASLPQGALLVTGGGHGCLSLIQGEAIERLGPRKLYFRAWPPRTTSGKVHCLVFVNKVLLEHSCAHSCTRDFWLLSQYGSRGEQL